MLGSSLAERREHKRINKVVGWAEWEGGRSPIRGKEDRQNGVEMEYEGWVLKEKNERTRISSLNTCLLPDTATPSTWPSSRQSSPPRSTISAQTSPSTLSTRPDPPLPRPGRGPPAAPPPFRSFARSNRTPLLSSSRNPDPSQHPPPPILIRSSPRWSPRASQLPLPLHRAKCSPALWESKHTHLMF